MSAQISVSALRPTDQWQLVVLVLLDGILAPHHLLQVVHARNQVFQFVIILEFSLGIVALVESALAA